LEPNEIISEILARKGISQVKFSRMLGKTDKFISVIFSQNREPKARTLARYCDLLDYDLIVRSREDGSEYFITPREP